MNSRQRRKARRASRRRIQAIRDELAQFMPRSIANMCTYPGGMSDKRFGAYLRGERRPAEEMT